MTTPSNNDRPSETPKPPEGYPGWLETIIWCQGGSAENRYARSELSALRAKAAAYDEAMKLLFYALAGQMKYYEIEQLIRKESKSGRFTP